MTSPAPDPITESQRIQLGALRHALLDLHKAMLDAERLRIDREDGPVGEGLALLNLVLHDPRFAWLRRISALIVQIDEQLEADEPMASTDARLLFAQTRLLLTANADGDEFQRNYDRLLQDNPEVVLLQGTVTRILKE